MKNVVGGSTARQLATYLPHLQRHRVAQRNGPARMPSAQPLSCANLMVDIVGFTALAERLAEAGPVGAEQLSDVLNTWFGAMIDIIHAHGGDVWIIAGDSAHVLWPASEGGGLEEPVALAAQCALEVQRRMSTFQSHGTSLRLRAAVGAGTVSCYELGGVEGRWVPLLTGEPIVQVSRGTQVARPGEVVLSPEAWTLLAGRGTGDTREGGQVCLSAISIPVELPTAGRPDELQESHAQVLRSYVPPVVSERLLAGQTEYLAEFRTVSVMFVHLSSLDAAASFAELAGPQEVVSLAQEQLRRFGGTLYQLLRDEKGTTLVAAFGLPPMAHDDDARRAVEAARIIRERLSALGQRAGIGVATGRVFCGAYGHPSRLQYSLVGTTMNLAARLMQATAGDGLLCDNYTRQAADRELRFEELELISVKGFQSPVRVFRPEGRRDSAPPSVARMLGRGRELEQLEERVRRVEDERQGGACLIRAEAGMGKSLLVAHLRGLAHARGVSVFHGAAESIETQTPYYAFRSLVARWLGLEAETSPASAARHVQEWLREHHPDLLELAPLLGTLLSLELPDNSLTRQMLGQARADNLHRLLLRVATHVAEHEPSLFLIEDAHWLDSSSWALVRLLVDKVPSALVVLSFRPLADAPAELKAIQEDSRTSLVDLQPLGASDIFELVCARLGVGSLPESLQALILEKAEGNPFYSEELVLALRDAGIIDTSGGQCTLVGGEQALARASFPGTLSGLITSRIDRLQPQVQLTLKVASVIGRAFEDYLLHGIHPLAGDRAEVPTHLSALSQLDFIAHKAEESDPVWSFRHAVTHETTYGLLPFALRRTLHRAAAEYLERIHASDLTPVYALLAHHWMHAEVAEKAATALARAGEHALKVYANQEAIAFLSKALEFDARARAQTTVDTQRCRLHRMLAEAHYSLNHYAEARAHCEAALRAAGLTPPQVDLQMVPDLANHVLRRWSGESPALPEEQRERYRLALHVLEILSICHNWENNRAAFAHSALMSRNVADQVGPCAESAFAQAQLGYMLAVVGMRGVAERDLRRAVAMAEETGELQSIVSCHVMLGMFHSMSGQASHALAPLRRADSCMQLLNGGLWKHRPRFMLAEALMCLGKYPEAQRGFSESVLLSLGAEPHVAGMSTALSALCLLRMGRATEALALLQGREGLPLLRRHPVPLSVFLAQAVLAETHLELGDEAQALRAVEQAEQLLASGQTLDDYFASTLGHAAVAELYLHLWERQQSGGPVTLEKNALKSRTRAACKRLKKIANLYPGARARHELALGRLHWLEGSKLLARRAWRSALELASEAGTPYEQGLAHHEFGRHANGAERTTQLEAACRIFERHGLVYALERSRSVLRPPVQRPTDLTPPRSVIPNKDGKTRVIILGSGPAGLAAAFELTRTPALCERFDVTVYQVGWRSGGNCSSGRMPPYQQVEQNGTHFLFGCYHDSFDLVRQAYDELTARGDTKCGTFEEAFLARSTVVCRQFFQGQWTNWELRFPSSGVLPEARGPRDYLRAVMRWALSLFSDNAPEKTRSPEMARLEKLLREGVEGIERFLSSSGPAPEKLTFKPVEDVLRKVRSGLWTLLRPRLETDLGALRFWILLDLALTTGIGMIEDDVFGPEGFAVIDNRDYRNWLEHHGASQLAWDSPVVRMWYDAVAAYQGGDVERPNLSAGVSLEALARAVFTYRGAFAWQMKSEIGDSFIAPIVQALRYRGVKFRYFHRVRDVVPEDGRIGRVTVEQQVELVSGNPDAYEPFIEVKGRRAWPAHPRYEQLRDPERVKELNLESFYTDQVGPLRELRYGTDFEHVVYAMPVGTVPFYCQRILAEREDWRRMAQNTLAVETQSLRLNFKKNLAELGWPGPVPIVSAIPPPLSTWEEASQLIGVETWPPELEPKSIETAFGALPAPEQSPGPEAKDYPRQQQQKAEAAAMSFLQGGAGTLWPGVASSFNPAGIDWDQLVDPQNRPGEERLQAQTIRANCGPLERYTMAMAGGLQYRLRPDGSGYTNMVLAGDWVRNGLDIGSVEGAVMAGRQAAEALTGRLADTPQQAPAKKFQAG
ncbi:AAA family ATPase [Vitiosangium sp. GDMCC 1.1324]|uniref:AAA family ATPase n=1 Tax=Vitiosangium sp. (strain GDMCC 1.1324) TaxID=2138576 RepID=UPI000D3CA314|nr:AAA family ATPase [Vitiosangium sp. GDMCC 1.1324]PTL84473.1 hypothetical protein DAT35_05125 [Vitiosangium sp. GDMCC 1.1324]